MVEERVEEQLVDDLKGIADRGEETEVGTSTRGARGGGSPPP